MFTEKDKKRFWSHVEVKNSILLCWEWKLSLDKYGYGKTKICGKYYVSHRVAYEMYTEFINKALFVLHSCDNPKCCNPFHLFQGTHQDNIKDSMQKNRRSRLHTPQKLTQEKANLIRIDFRYGISKLALGRKYNVSPSTIRNIINEKSWKAPSPTSAPNGELMPLYTGK